MRARAEADKRVLLHVCCGPCSEWPVATLRAEGYAVDAYFYNPNIHPQAELDLRLENMRRMAALHGVRLYEDRSCMEARWRQMQALGKARHCRFCYRLRLDEAARFAQLHGYKYLTTSLQVSPYQDQDLIARIAAAACQKRGLTFLSRPFREGYKEGQRQAGADGLYRQKYCGCIYSLNETLPKFKKRRLEELGLREEDLPVRAP